MELQELREELITYIHLADEKKLQALQALLLDEKDDVEYKWWEDETFVADLKEEDRQIKSGEIKGFTEEEANNLFQARIKNRKLVHV